MNHAPHDMYFDNPQRSPQHRHTSQPLHRQPSRQQFDAYGGGIPYGNEDHAVQQQGYMPRYPDRMGAATINASYQPNFDPWNTSYNGQSNTMGPMGAPGRMKNIGGNGRPSLPGVGHRAVEEHHPLC